MDNNKWREELAWAAGFFDGEGTFGIWKNGAGGKGVAVSIPQINREPLDRFKAAVLDLGTVRGPYKTQYQDRYDYRVTNTVDLQAIYVMLYPFLSTPKREQGRSVMESMTLTPKRRTGDASLEGVFCKRDHPQWIFRNRFGACQECNRIRDRERYAKHGRR